MDQSSTNQNRKAPRSHFFMKASIELDGRHHDVRLRNLSAEGALIEAEDLPVEGAEILFRKEKLSVPGRIAWSADGRAGVAFAQRLEPDVVRRHVPQPRQRANAPTRRPGLKSHELSEGERRFAEEWIFGRPPSEG
ncbi:PilZ domain-containing protein [Sphingomicrobium sediminis]|uniref:PilZ domain-containing protein n=1 Tax=Sphingomicrobium sediminis TaxID=2950949 RepID=A0A9X2EK59_9SPHN|nr:PilZ domain-containing protein [Sphingomicrobium sediminis]MCM8557104.1 PilZ domain-containing protein [Sphingomicrobium sediminis]